MKLSIIIPVYNVEPFLERCINSLGDLPEGVEAIFVDDGSPDKCGAILDKYSDCFTIIHQKNKGVCAARNAGLDAAKGEYIVNLDSDDCYVPDAIPQLLDIIDKRSAEDIIQFNFFQCKDGNCTITGRHAVFNKVYTLDKLPPYWMLVWNKLYRRSFLEQHNIRFREGMKYDDDTQFNIQCFRYISDLPCVDNIIVKHYYDNEGSITHTINREKFISATEAMLEMLREDNPPMVDRIIRERIVFKWQSKQYRRIFGGD